MRNETFYPNGTLHERWDDATRTFTSYTVDGQLGNSRPYTVEENAAADLRATVAAQTANDATVTTALSVALATLQTLLDTPNATINAGPAPYIKDLARVQKRVIRKLLRVFDATD